MTEAGERARALAVQGAADVAPMRALLGHEEVPDSIVGFHAQQAAEKLLKAVLTSRGLAYPRTHSIRALLDPAAYGGVACRPSWRRCKTSPYAVRFRYEAYLADERHPAPGGVGRPPLRRSRRSAPGPAPGRRARPCSSQAGSARA